MLAVLEDPLGAVEAERVSDEELPDRVRELEERRSPRWTVRSLRTFYPPLLASGIRLRRAHDLLLCHAILRDTASLAEPLPPSPRWVRTDVVAGADDLVSGEQLTDDAATHDAVGSAPTYGKRVHVG